MHIDVRQLERQLDNLDRDRDLERAKNEVQTLQREMSRLQSKLDDWAEKQREREASILEERHNLQRQIEEAKREANAPKS